MFSSLRRYTQKIRDDCSVVPWVVAGVLLTFAVAYLIVFTDGTYLGRGFVRWMYDRAAPRWAYPTNERHQLIDKQDLIPAIASALSNGNGLRTLDVGCGTGRVALALLREAPLLCENIVGADLSGGMLTEAQRMLGPAIAAGRASLVRTAAEDLPFADGAFAFATSVEALLSFVRPRRALSEIVRVVAPGGVVLVTKRADILAVLVPGRDFTRRRLTRAFRTLGCTEVTFYRYRGSVPGSEIAIARKA